MRDHYSRIGPDRPFDTFAGLAPDVALTQISTTYAMDTDNLFHFHYLPKTGLTELLTAFGNSKLSLSLTGRAFGLLLCVHSRPGASEQEQGRAVCKLFPAASRQFDLKD